MKRSSGGGHESISICTNQNGIFFYWRIDIILLWEYTPIFSLTEKNLFPSLSQTYMYNTLSPSPSQQIWFWAFFCYINFLFHPPPSYRLFSTFTPLFSIDIFFVSHPAQFYLDLSTYPAVCLGLCVWPLWRSLEFGSQESTSEVYRRWGEQHVLPRYIEGGEKHISCRHSIVYIATTCIYEMHI